MVLFIIALDAKFFGLIMSGLILFAIAAVLFGLNAWAKKYDVQNGPSES